MSLWSAIGSIGSTLLGGLFGRKKQSTSNTVDYVSMVRNAEAAGFNPLTALRNGGAAGFTTTTTPAAPLSSVIGQGLAEGVGKFLETFDPHADKMREKTYALLDAQVRNLDAQSGAIFPAMPGGFHSPGTYGGTYEGRPSGRAGQLSASSAPLGSPQAPEAGGTTVTNPWHAAKVDPDVRDAEAFETRYGGSEIGQMLYGGYVGLNDVAANYPTGRRGNLILRGRDWWSSAADADYERHRKKYARPAFAR